MVGITRKYKEEDQNKYCTGEKLAPQSTIGCQVYPSTPPPKKKKSPGQAELRAHGVGEIEILHSRTQQ